MPLFHWDSAILSHFRQLVNPSVEYLSDKTSPFFWAISVSPKLREGANVWLNRVPCVGRCGAEAPRSPQARRIHSRQPIIGTSRLCQIRAGHVCERALTDERNALCPPARKGVLSLRAGSGARPFGDGLRPIAWVGRLREVKVACAIYPSPHTGALRRVG
jgi:hypothetical protein